MALPEWLSFSQLSGSGDTIITVTAATMGDLTSRTSSFLVSGNTKSVTVPVIQYHDYKGDYLTFNITAAGSIRWKVYNIRPVISVAIEYKKNDDPWTSITGSTNSAATFQVEAGDVVQFRGNNSTYYREEANSFGCSFTGSTAEFTLSGNINSLLSPTDFANIDTLTGDTSFAVMFRGTKVTDASKLLLPATALTKACYSNLFLNCYYLTTPPELPATNLGEWCYSEMFKHCDSLTTVPELPATQLQPHCYELMFQDCTGITTSPVLSATTLADYSYQQMFWGCSHLSHIECNAVNFGTDSTFMWTNGVRATGTFYKNANATWETGINGIPSGWTVVNA